MAIARMNPKESPEEAPSRTRNASFFGLKWPFHKHEQTQQSVFTPIPVANNTLERYKALARLQYIAYCPTGINTWNCGICSDKASPLKNTTLGVQFSNSAQTVFGIVGVSHDLERIFVAFQGALKARQWARCYEMAMRRPDALGVKDKNVFVHFGFYKSYMEIRPLVINLLLERRAQYPLYKFLVLGHSYGGGVSGIMALDFASGLLGNLIAPRFVEWVTFGSPRVGNHEYARAMNRAPWVNQARLVHSTDIVAHTPAKVKQLGTPYFYYTVMIMAYIDKSKRNGLPPPSR